MLLTFGLTIPLFKGWSYYSLPSFERTSNKAHHIFGSTGSYGIATGIVALILFITNILYLGRKLLLGWHKLGNLRGWLRWHVASGFLGAAYVAVHSAFRIRSEVTWVCLGALGIVLASGVVGRFLVELIPRTSSGDTMSLTRLQDDMMIIVDRIRDHVAHDPAALMVLKQMVDGFNERETLALSRFSHMRAELEKVKIRLQTLREACNLVGGANTFQIQHLLDKVKRLHKRSIIMHFANRLLSTWRPLHRILAIIFVMTAFIHIAAAIQAGFLVWF